MDVQVVMVDEDTVEITFRFARLDARVLSAILSAAADKGKIKGGTYKWSQVSRRINSVVTWPVLRYGHFERPSDEYGSSEVDIDHVVNGSPPYPLLCPPDLKEAWRQLEAKMKSVAEISRRLQVSDRTISRWRKQEREGEK